MTDRPIILLTGNRMKRQSETGLGLGPGRPGGLLGLTLIFILNFSIGFQNNNWRKDCS